MTSEVLQAPPRRTLRTTSVAVWAMIIAAALALMLVRLPALIAVAEEAGAAAAEALDDPAIAATATTIGAVGGIALHAAMLVIAALLVSLLERWLGPRAIAPRDGAQRLRIGVAGVVFAATVLGQHVAAVMLGVAAIQRGPLLWGVAAAIAVAAPLLFPAARQTFSTYVRALVVSLGTAVLLCLG